MGRKEAEKRRPRSAKGSREKKEKEEEEISCFSLWKKGSPVFQFRCNLHHPPARPAAHQMEAASKVEEEGTGEKENGGERRDLLEFSARRWKNAAAMGFPMPRQLLPLLTSAPSSC
jgi:hypothetical protein